MDVCYITYVHYSKRQIQSFRTYYITQYNNKLIKRYLCKPTPFWQLRATFAIRFATCSCTAFAGCRNIIQATSQTFGLAYASLHTTHAAGHNRQMLCIRRLSGFRRMSEHRPSHFEKASLFLSVWLSPNRNQK